MIVKNGKRILSSMMRYASNSSITVSVVNVGGTSATWSNWESADSEMKTVTNSYTASGTVSDANKGICMRLGTGTTAPTLNDHALENIATSLSCMSSSISMTDGGSVLYTFGFYNDSDTPVTVTEAALILNSSRANPSSAVLLARELIQPHTISAYGSSVFTFELSFG